MNKIFSIKETNSILFIFICSRHSTENFRWLSNKKTFLTFPPLRVANTNVYCLGGIARQQPIILISRPSFTATSRAFLIYGREIIKNQHGMSAAESASAISLTCESQIAMRKLSFQLSHNDSLQRDEATCNYGV